MKYLSLVVAFIALTFSVPAETIRAQVEGSDQESNIEAAPAESKRLRRKKRRKRMRKPPPPTLEEEVEERFEVPGEPSAAGSENDKHRSTFLPDWTPPTFSWSLGPIIGFKYQSVSQERTSVSTVHSEFGGAAALRGVPLVAGNPGAYLAPGIGYAVGRVDGQRKYDETGEEEDLKYRYDRLYVGTDLAFYYGWYRHTLGVSGGRKIFYQEDDSIEGKPANLYTASLMNDFGVLLLPWISGHYTHTYRQTHFTGFDEEPFLREHDNWIHSRLFTNVLSFYIDIGPGFTNTTEIVQQGEPEEAKLIGRVDYFKALAGLHLFWKLGASGHAKYVYNSTEEQLGNNSKILLPGQDLYETPRVVMPEDSFISSTFIGASDVFFGFGLGWQYNIQVLNVSKKGNRERETTQDNGFAVTYTAKF